MSEPASERAREQTNNSKYAVIFTSQRTEGHAAEYEQMAERMIQLASSQKGFLGVESARGADGLGITVSYWQSLEDIKNWKQQADHLEAQKQGRSQFYSSYKVRITGVIREY